MTADRQDIVERLDRDYAISWKRERQIDASGSIVDAITEITGLRAERDTLRDALREIRKAAGSGKEFTNRMQYIHARAGCAIDGLPWDDDRKREFGYTIRDRTMAENDTLRKEVETLRAVTHLCCNNQANKDERDTLRAELAAKDAEIAQHREQAGVWAQELTDIQRNNQKAIDLREETHRQTNAALLAKTAECAALAKDAEQLRIALARVIVYADDEGQYIARTALNAALAIPPAQEPK